MKVHQLIAKLQQCPQNSDVTLMEGDIGGDLGIDIGFVGAVLDGSKAEELDSTAVYLLCVPDGQAIPKTPDDGSLVN